MAGVVVVGRLHADFVSGVVSGEGVVLAGCAIYRLAVAQPLVSDAILRHAVVVFHICNQFAADFGVAADGHFTFVIGLRLRRWPVRIVFHLQCKFFAEGATLTVISRNSELNGWFFSEVKMLIVF